MVALRFFLFWILCSIISIRPLFAQNLKVSENHHYLECDGKPFFWLGDTAWELFHRLNREEVTLYLEDRASKGFTVIQAVVLAELGGLTVPNAYGALPLDNQDPNHLNEAYFEHVDFVIRKANSLGMFVGLLPTWGDKFNKKWGVGPEIFNKVNALRFGKILAERYKDDQVIWILGGDRNPENPTHYQVIEAMAKGINQVVKEKQLITYHPQGWSNSSDFFADAEWIDLHLFQSGHGARDAANYQFNRKNLSLQNLKPTIDGEPRYEDHPVNWKGAELGWFDDFDVRQAAYWSMLSGAAGHTYGNHNIWQMWEEGRVPISMARTNWQTALHHIGAIQMGMMKTFFEKIKWYQLLPNQSLIVNENPEGASYQMAAIREDGKLAVVYTPYGRSVQVDFSKLKGDSFEAYWFNPRDGHRIHSMELMAGQEELFTPHSAGRGSDWVLVVQAN
ncbi:glycoside hydrolase family 140 protein [Echinicola sp. CAU 1574]|uniref:Glycoside hydrolase family 140 protein n=2 Tax=Echinicola arenosa TaxID=2774144 RepID=A0ABR9AQ81_9BACT|nr:glycoside hydrolase family 140 protein [Echinicola arenosa]